jgi:hypothetical protein
MAAIIEQLPLHVSDAPEVCWQLHPAHRECPEQSEMSRDPQAPMHQLAN